MKLHRVKYLYSYTFRLMPLMMMLFMLFKIILYSLKLRIFRRLLLEVLRDGAIVIAQLEDKDHIFSTSIRHNLQ